MKRSAKIVVSLGVMLLFALAGMSGTKALLSVQEDDESDQASSATRVAVASPEQRRMQESVTTTGTIMPVRAVRASCELSDSDSHEA